MPFITILIFGALAGSFALVLELLTMSLFSLPFAMEEIFSFSTFFIFLLLACIEEISKFIFLNRYKKYSLLKNSQTISSFITLAILFGIGFSSLETILSFQDISLLSLSSILKTLLLHISTSLLFVYFIFYKKERKPIVHSVNLWLILSTIFIHLIYNIILF
ncbi:MAG: PrsW family glutamic-type intramembrane protease, partial [Candidatus Moraniibacteriota bacterium]